LAVSKRLEGTWGRQLSWNGQSLLEELGGGGKGYPPFNHRPDLR
jgi:hypothetical protein